MKALLSAIALTTFFAAAASAAQPGSTPSTATEPVQLTAAQLDVITAGTGSKGKVGDSDPVTLLGSKLGMGSDGVTLLGSKLGMGTEEDVGG